ncbi:PQQ-dependent sugar dehydrogenase [Mucilaginibacter lacusdianchii]|uniref:PQQ-dependent sugar dehydrogenase n=1 Tax=Mucilaginibacter lacusdianchii TaxID=2684211 RepID=UPI00131B68BC|nr:PQQ-dependent sugar dehydrogenase [Mucilaginibacter sp. JXJ CY 39]
MQSVVYKIVISGFLLTAALTACHHNEPSAGAGNQKPNDTQPGTSTPVETNAPNSSYKPAFAGQTRIGGVHTQTPLAITVLNSNLQRPWAICNLPDGRFLVTQKGGSMLILAPDGKVNKQITGLPAVVDEGQGGLLDVNIDPQFTDNRMLYWDYAERTSGGSLLAVAKGRLSADETKIENVQVIYRAEPAYNGGLQYGSRILFDEQGNLFVSTGERGADDIRVKAQDLSAAIGKVIHITKEGKPVAGGPFAGTAGARPEIYAYGLRNPEGMTWNPDTHELWEVEFGPRGGDEVNIIRAGKNYGWPVITYGIEYAGGKVGEGIQQKDGMEQPLYYWDPVISPAGITFYNSDIIPEWKGNLFIGALSGSHVCRLVIKDNKVVGEERLLADKGERFRAITQGKDGALYTVTDGGKLYKIAKK